MELIKTLTENSQILKLKEDGSKDDCTNNELCINTQTVLINSSNSSESLDDEEFLIFIQPESCNNLPLPIYKVSG